MAPATSIGTPTRCSPAIRSSTSARKMGSSSAGAVPGVAMKVGATALTVIPQARSSIHPASNGQTPRSSLTSDLMRNLAGVTLVVIAAALLGLGLQAALVEGNEPRGGTWGTVALFVVAGTFAWLGAVLQDRWSFPVRVSWVGFHNAEQAPVATAGNVAETILTQDTELSTQALAKKLEWLIGVATRVIGELHGDRLMIEGTIRSGYLWDETARKLSNCVFEKEREALSTEPSLRGSFPLLVETYNEIERLNEWNPQLNFNHSFRDSQHGT
jgi:hypothetical protein